MIDEIVICLQCKGKGFIEEDIGYHSREIVDVACPLCEGSGRLFKSVSTTYVPYKTPD